MAVYVSLISKYKFSQAKRFLVKPNAKLCPTGDRVSQAGSQHRKFLGGRKLKVVKEAQMGWGRGCQWWGVRSFQSPRCQWPFTAPCSCSWQGSWAHLIWVQVLPEEAALALSGTSSLLNWQPWGWRAGPCNLSCTGWWSIHCNSSVRHWGSPVLRGLGFWSSLAVLGSPL